MTTLVLLRPWWLLACLPLAALWWWRRKQGGERAGSWQHAVDAHLLPHLLVQGTSAGSRRWSQWLLPLLAGVGIVALAGPSWREVEVPLSQTEAPLVLAVDLSSGSRAADLKPSRLAQVRAKLKQLVAAREGGQLGLVVFADDAFGAAPITRDAHTLDNLLDALSPDVMPTDGHRPDRAIAVAVEQMQKAGFQRGTVLLLTDHADARAQAAARRAASAGFRTSVLGVGTAAGAPLATREGFVTDAQGQVQLARLDAASLAALAAAGNGRYTELTRADQDLQRLDLLTATGEPTLADTGSGLSRNRQRGDDGYWLLPVVLLLAALAWWRRGERALWVLLFGLGSAFLTPPRPALAQPAPPAPMTTPAAPAAAPPQSVARSWWQSLWQRQDQQARQALDSGDHATAQVLATDPSLRGAAAFRAGDYAQAAQAWEQQPDDTEALYNRGTALAADGQLDAALKVLESALARQPDHADALANRQAILDYLERQRQQQQQQQQRQDGQPGEPQQPQQNQDAAQQDQQDPSQSGQQKSAASADSQQSQGQSGSSASPEEEKSGPTADPSDDPARDPDTDQAAAAGEQAPESSREQQQQQAAEAQKQAMQQALENQTPEGQPGEPDPAAAPPTPMTAEQRSAAEQQQALQQWLRRVPDDPGALLRRKFALEQQRRAQEQARAPRPETPQ